MATTPEIRSDSRPLESFSELVIGPLPKRSHANRPLGIVFALCDAVIILCAGTLAYKLDQLLQPGDSSLVHSDYLRLIGLLLCYAVLALVCKASQGLYETNILHSAQISRVRTLKSIVLASMLFILILFLSEQRPISAGLLTLTMFLSLAGILTMQHALQSQNLKRIERGIGTQHVLIVGAGEIGLAFRRYLETHGFLGKTFCGFVDDRIQCSPEWLGTPADLPNLITKHFVDEVYFTPEIDRELIMEIATRAKESGVSVKVVPDLYGGLALGATLTHIGNVPVLELSNQPAPAFELWLKRCMDLVFAFLGLLITSPVMAVAALAIKLDSPGPVIYAAWRVGRKGRRFRCYKFRTMVSEADRLKDYLRHMNERDGATFKIANDPRITRVGRFLRRYSIDELPQFYNVLRGDMSIVGPRPHPVDDFQHYQLADLRRLDVLPGITGMWQVNARHDPSFEKNVLLDLEYIQNWTIWLDLKIILKTVPEVCRGAGR